MTKTSTRTTLTIKTGRRTWNLTIIGTSHGGQFLYCESASGKQYLVNRLTKVMSGTRKTREDGTKLYHWGITEGCPRFARQAA